MDLIQPNDPQYFTETSEDSYDRHSYRVSFKNNTSVIFDDWETARNHWFQWSGMKQLSTIDVLDRKETNKKINKGF